MREQIKEIYWNIWTRLRLLRLHFVRIEEPEDAKSAEEMLREIKERLKLT